MKFIGKILLMLLLILILGIIAVYIILQTRWGAGWVSQKITGHTDYNVSVGEVKHRLTRPSQLVLQNVSIGRHDQPATLIADEIHFRLQLSQLLHPSVFSRIDLYRGNITLAEKGQPSSVTLPFQADSLRFHDVGLTRPTTDWPFTAQKLSGTVTPWHPQSGNPLGQRSAFEFNIAELDINHVKATKVYIQGQNQGNHLTLNNLGADISRGTITAKAERDANGNWLIHQLLLNNLRLQTDKPLTDLLAPLKKVHGITLKQASITQLNLQGPDWALVDLSVRLNDLKTATQDGKQPLSGALRTWAKYAIYGGLELQDVLFDLDFTPQGATLSQFKSRWEKGLISTYGLWEKGKKQLTLTQLDIAGFEYTLPQSWRQYWFQPLPDWLENLSVNQLSASQNLLIDGGPRFPFQITGLNASGNALQLIKDHRWGIWQGSLELSASDATFNRVDLRRPSLGLVADDQQINIREYSALSGNGLLEGQGLITQRSPQQVSLTLEGRQVEPKIFSQWGWPGTLPPGEGNWLLQLQARPERDKPLKPTVNATLSANSDDRQLQQIMRQGELQ